MIVLLGGTGNPELKDWVETSGTENQAAPFKKSCASSVPPPSATIISVMMNFSEDVLSNVGVELLQLMAKASMGLEPMLTFGPCG